MAFNSTSDVVEIMHEPALGEWISHPLDHTARVLVNAKLIQ